MTKAINKKDFTKFNGYKHLKQRFFSICTLKNDYVPNDKEPLNIYLKIVPLNINLKIVILNINFNSLFSTSPAKKFQQFTDIHGCLDKGIYAL